METQPTDKHIEWVKSFDMITQLQYVQTYESTGLEFLKSRYIDHFGTKISIDKSRLERNINCGKKS